MFKLGSTIAKSVIGGGTLPLLIVGALIASLGTAYIKGKSVEAEKARTAELERTVESQRAVMDRLARQIAVAEAARDAANKRLIADMDVSKNEKAEADVFDAEIRNRPDLWIIGPDDARRLSGIGR